MKNVWHLPSTLTAKAVSELSTGAFANHDFTNAEGFHITGISGIGMQLRKGNTEHIKNVRFSEVLSAEGSEIVFNVKFNPERR